MPLLYPPFPSPTLPRLLSHWQVATGCPLLSWAWRSPSTWRVYGPSGTINMSRLLASAARRQHCCVGVCVSVVGVVSLHKMTYEAHNWNFKGDGAQSGHKLGGWSALAKVSRARWWQQSRGGQKRGMQWMRGREIESETETVDEEQALSACKTSPRQSISVVWQPRPTVLHASTSASPSPLLLVTLRPSISAGTTTTWLAPRLRSLCVADLAARPRPSSRCAMRNVPSLSAFVFCDNFHILRHKLSTSVSPT